MFKRKRISSLVFTSILTLLIMTVMPAQANSTNSYSAQITQEPYQIQKWPGGYLVVIKTPNPKSFKIEFDLKDEISVMWNAKMQKKSNNDTLHYVITEPIYPTNSFGFIVSTKTPHEIENLVINGKSFNDNSNNDTTNDNNQDNNNTNDNNQDSDNTDDTQKDDQSNKNDRYFPEGTSVSDMKQKASQLSKKEVKQMLIKEIDSHWDFISKKLNMKTKKQAYAFFLGFATRESTLNAGLETAIAPFGQNPAHAFGPLQTAEPAYDCKGINDDYMIEDVPELFQYKLTDENFYDPGISVHMGIRKFIHFINLAEEKYTGSDILRHALMGFNTGWIDGSSESWMKEYADEIAALGGWYLNNDHLNDDEFTWTSDSHVDRNNPWQHYK